MDEIITDLSFDEVDIFKKEIISFHIPHSKKLDVDHKYFTKRIVWVLIEWKNTDDYPYKEIEEDEINRVHDQEALEQIVNEMNGISNLFIKDKINSKNCFSFDYKPNEFDKLILRSDYEFKEIKKINQPTSRGWSYVSLTYKNGNWEIDEQVEKRVVKQQCRTGVVRMSTKG